MNKESIIIAGFPGVGKTFASDHQNDLGLNIFDCECSNFHWTSENGTKKLNPEWPKNYIDFIKETMSKEDHPDYIMVSTHPEVLKKISEMEVNCIVFCPSHEMKDEYIDKYKAQKRPDEFIENIKNNWGNYLYDIMHFVLNAEKGILMLIEIRKDSKIKTVYDFLSNEFNNAVEFFD